MLVVEVLLCGWLLVVFFLYLFRCALIWIVKYICNDNLNICSMQNSIKGILDGFSCNWKPWCETLQIE